MKSVAKAGLLSTRTERGEREPHIHTINSHGNLARRKRRARHKRRRAGCGEGRKTYGLEMLSLDAEDAGVPEGQLVEEPRDLGVQGSLSPPPKAMLDCRPPREAEKQIDAGRSRRSMHAREMRNLTKEKMWEHETDGLRGECQENYPE